MQYKIPVQIENEDPIVLGLSLRQLMIIMGFGGIWYLFFISLSEIAPVEIAAVPAIILLLLWILIAKFKQYGMSFIGYVLSFLRLKSNVPERRWMQWVDSFQPIDIWFQSEAKDDKTQKVDFDSKRDKMKNIEDHLHKI